MYFKELRCGFPLATALLVLSGCAAESNDATTRAAPPAALSVVTQAVFYEDELVRRDTLTGRIEPNRQSDVGFELPGQLVAVVVDEGDTVLAGDVLARLDTARLDARRAEVEASVRQAKAQARLARTTLARVQEALSFEGVSQQEVDEAANALATAEASVAAAESRRFSVDVDVQKSELKAPYNAVVTARHSDEGQVLQAGQPVLSLQESDNLVLRVGVAGEALDTLVPGSAHTISVDGREIDVTLKQVLAQRDRVARTVDALFTVPSDTGLRAGDLARLVLDQPLAVRGVWLPLDALAEGRRGLWTVYVAAPEGQSELGATHQVTPRPVDIVHQDGRRAFVRGPLENGEPVIISGLQRIVPGQFVRIDQTVATP